MYLQQAARLCNKVDVSACEIR